MLYQTQDSKINVFLNPLLYLHFGKCIPYYVFPLSFSASLGLSCSFPHNSAVFWGIHSFIPTPETNTNLYLTENCALNASSLCLYCISHGFETLYICIYEMMNAFIQLFHWEANLDLKHTSFLGKFVCGQIITKTSLLMHTLIHLYINLQACKLLPTL